MAAASDFDATWWNQSWATGSPWGAAASSLTVPRMSVSGQSAGGSMALAHFVAFSRSVDSVAVAGGSPYGCGGLKDPYYYCYYGLTEHLEKQSIEYVHWRYKQGAIDPLSGMRNTPVRLFSGTNDNVVWKSVMKATERQLRVFVNTTQLHSRFDTGAGHVWSVDHGSCSCGQCPDGGNKLCCDINNCQFDLSGAVLGDAYGSLRPRVTAHHKLYWVEQWNYLPPNVKRPQPSPAVRNGATLMKWAVVYVPSKCEGDVTRCQLHVNYHGCTNLKWSSRLTWVRHLDLIEYGEANDVVIVFPQAWDAVGAPCAQFTFASRAYTRARARAHAHA